MQGDANLTPQALEMDRIAQEHAEALAGSLEHLSKDELYERARDLNIEGRSNMDKEDLLAAVRAAL